MAAPYKPQRDGRSLSQDRNDRRYPRGNIPPPPPPHAVQGARNAWQSERFQDSRGYVPHEYGPEPEPAAAKSDVYRLESIIKRNCDNIHDAISKTFKELDKGITETIQAQFDAQPTTTDTARGGIWSSLTSSQDQSHHLKKQKELRDRLKLRDAEILSVKTQLEVAEQRQVEQESRADDLQNQLKQAQDTLSKAAFDKKSLVDERSRLKNIIQTNNLRDGEPLDDEFIKWFADLRDLIQSLVRECLDIPPNPFYDGENMDIRNFYDFLNTKLPSSTRDNKLKIDRVRGMIFWILQRTIFSKRIFGIGAEVEEGLAMLEQSLVNIQGASFSDFLKWRKRTILCIQSLQHAHTPREPIDILLDFCMPLKQATEYNSGETNLEKRIEDLCIKTYQFALRLRATESLFEVRSLDNGLPVHSNKGKDYSVQASEGISVKGGIPKGAKVSYTIFGYLEKKEHPSSEPLYLERAHIVVTA